MAERLRRLGLSIVLVVGMAAGLTVSSPTVTSASAVAGIVSISAGSDAQTCALAPVGGVECWGDNTYGQLGDSTSTGPSNCSTDIEFDDPCSTTPVDVSGLGTGVRAISGSCALLDTGGVECWGDNTGGQLGDGSAAGPDMCINGYPCSTTPVQVSGLTSGVMAISASTLTVCALLVTGGVKCWGDNESGQLGDGTNTGPDMCRGFACSTTPVDVSGLTSGVAAISAGGGVSCALLNTGGVKCWGDNTTGELGDGTSTGPQTCGTFACSTTPVDVSGLTSGVSAISAAGWASALGEPGSGDACAVLNTGGVKCWGENNDGQLGAGATFTGPETCDGIGCSTTPVDVSGLTSGVTGISVGYQDACALTLGGGVECWGAGGDLGDGTNTGPDINTTFSGNSTTPVDVSGLGSGVTEISTSFDHSCALLSTGAVMCWGGNYRGELGDGTNVYRSTPVDVVGLIVVSNAPMIGSVARGDDSVSVTFTPGPDGGSPVTSFIASCSSSNGGVSGSGSGAGSPVVVTGLTAGKTYTCTVVAMNASGASPPSAASNTFVPVHAPTAPTGASATPGSRSATLRWQVPSSDGGSAVTGYVVTSYLAGIPQQSRTFNTSATQELVTGLTNARIYTFTVAAKNVFGVSPQSASSNAVIVGTPAAPTGVHPVWMSPGRFKVNFAPGSNNGAKTTGYAATCISTNGGVTKTGRGTGSPITVSGLSRGKAYRCTVDATNIRGTGPASSASAVVPDQVGDEQRQEVRGRLI